MHNSSNMMVNAMSMTANAKINLHLEVAGCREDGFHDIKSIFQKISLSDKLLIRPIKENRCKIHSPEFELPAGNTLEKAYSFFQEETGIRQGVEVFLSKNIPAGAGLGGGSSDAASLLLALKELSGAVLDEGVLNKIALKVGSDVPFFLEKASSAWVTGRGEKIKPVKTDNNCFGVLIVPEAFSSTEKAYALLDEFYKKTEKEKLENPCFFCGKRFFETPFFNNFEKPLFEVFPQIQKAKAALLNSGADFALMSGSGASVYGLYKFKETALKARLELSKQWKFCIFFTLLA